MANCESCRVDIFGACSVFPDYKSTDCRYQPKPEAQDKTLEETIIKIIEQSLAIQDDIYNCEKEGIVLTFRAHAEILTDAILSAIQSKYVLLVNQTPPENPYKVFDSSFGAGSYRGFRACYAIMTTPVLNPDGTYRVWMAVNLTKEQMEKLGK